MKTHPKSRKFNHALDWNLAYLEVATSALDMGVGVTGLRCIVHNDWPFSVLDYAQGEAEQALSRS
jgi:superfamily II DNA helicase RecQ